MAEPARTAQREPAHRLARHEPNRHAATLFLVQGRQPPRGGRAANCCKARRAPTTQATRARTAAAAATAATREAPKGRR
eukprot:12826684-Alexandrium_andersonii.AAC.1